MAALFKETLARTARTLRGRFEALRSLGPVPAAMAETPPGEPYPYRGGPTDRLPLFDSSDLPQPRWFGAAMVVRDGAHVGGRNLWLAGDGSAAGRLILACHDANGFVPLLRREFDLPAECGTGDKKLRWLWTVFELAERGVPGSLLSLLGPVFQCDESGVVRASEEDIRWAKTHPDDSESFSSLIRGEFVAAKHWQIADLVESCVMVMDLVEAAIGTEAEGANDAADALGVEAIQAAVSDSVKSALAEAKKPRKPRGESTCDRLKDLHENDPDFAEEAPETLVGERIDRSPGTFPDSHYWRTVLQPRRREVRAEIQQARKRLRKAQKWGDFNSVGQRDEDTESH